MLPGRGVPDAIRRGLGLAARAVGDWCDLYRGEHPHAPPIAPGNRVIRLPAAFANTRSFTAPVGYGDALWQGVFDSVYSRAGDYLVGADGTFFVASQPRLGPVLCVKTNRTLTLRRPAGPQQAGINRYMGVQASEAQPLLTGWPASVLTVLGGGKGALPGDAPGGVGGAGGWLALLPGAGVTLRPGDLASDDLGRVAVVSASEHTALGWRLHLRQVTS